MDSESKPSQWLPLWTGSHWPQPWGWKSLSTAVVYKIKGVCALGDVQGKSLGLKEEKIKISDIFLNLKRKMKLSFSNI